MKKETWIMWGESESGDRYRKVRFNHEPTEEDKKNYILNKTPEDLDIDGPGEFGSYVYIEMEKVDQC